MPSSRPVSVPDWVDEAKGQLRFHRIWGTSCADAFDPGQRPVGRAGRGTEWFGRREYVPGDPLNIVDWRALARRADLEDPPMYSKTFDAELSNLVTIAVDCSASMDTYPLEGKSQTALAVAGLLAYTAVQNSDPVRIVLVGGSGEEPLFQGQVSRTAQDFYEAMGEIDGLRLRNHGDVFLDLLHDPYEGSSELGHTLVLISDFFVAPEILATTVFQFRDRVRTVMAVRVLCPSDRRPFAKVDDLELIDVEKPRRRRRVRTNPGMFEKVFAEYDRQVEEIFAQENVRWTTVDAVRLGQRRSPDGKAPDKDQIVERLIEARLVEQI